ncbi:MAG: hypothetical protein ACK40C_09190 [Novosphingobium meiothermophilum]
MNIDEALIDLCKKHDLTALSVGVSSSFSRPKRFFLSAYAHAAGPEGLHTYGGSSISGTASEAIAHAIQQVNEVRARVVDVPDMELERGA